MLRQNDKKIRNGNLIVTFLVLLLVAGIVIMLSVSSKIEQFEFLQKEMKTKFLENKKEDIRFKFDILNLLIEKQSIRNTEESKNNIDNFIKQLNESNNCTIKVEELSENIPFYSILKSKGEYFNYSTMQNTENKKISDTLEYFLVNKKWNWVISASFKNEMMDTQIKTWEMHLHNLIRDNIYVHISLLFLFTISLLLVVYVINSNARKAIRKCQLSMKKREDSLKYKIAKLQSSLNEQEKKFLNQTKLIQKESKMLALGEMLGNLAHQWKLPLTDISTTIRELKKKIDDDIPLHKEDGETLNHIDNSAVYLSRTIDDFKVFLKADSLKIDFIASEIIEKAISINKSIIEKNKIKIVQTLDADILIHNLSFGLLQTLVNIIYNAKDVLKNRDEEDRFIFISTTNYKDKIELTITDTGNGIPQEIIGNIFKPYFTTKQKTYGTGLGLHMAYNIIKQNMSGTITVENKEFDYNEKHYKGASFMITLFLEEQFKGNTKS